MKLTAIALFTLLVLSPALGGPAAAAREVSIQVTSIVASTQLPEGTPPGQAPVVDPKLAGFGGKLESLFAYKEYSFAGSSRSGAGFGSACTFQLPERFSLEVEP